MKIRAFFALSLLAWILAASAEAQQTPSAPDSTNENLNTVEQMINVVSQQRREEQAAQSAPAANPSAANNSTSNASNNNPAPDTPAQPTSGGQSGAGIGGPIGSDGTTTEIERQFVGPLQSPKPPPAAGNSGSASVPPNPVQDFAQDLAQSGLFTPGPTGTPVQSSFTDNSTPAPTSSPPPNSAPNVIASSVPGETDPSQSSYPAIAAAQETLHGYEAAIPAAIGNTGPRYEGAVAKWEAAFDNLSIAGLESEPAEGWPAVPLQISFNNIGPAAQ